MNGGETDTALRLGIDLTNREIVEVPPIPVGTRVTPRPPDRSERALLTHSAPTSGV